MKAAVLHAPGPLTSASLKIETRDVPELTAGEILVAVRACGVCRTDLQIVEGALPPHRPAIVPGHQIVGIVSAVAPGVDLKVGTRVGISWLAGTDGTCRFCRSGKENLCDAPTFTGYDTDGGYATEVIARADFAYPLSDRIDDIHTAPLLCAGIIGFRSLRVAGVEKGERVGLFGFGSSAALAIRVLQSWNCEVYVVTRGDAHRKTAEALGATWVGAENKKPPVTLDRAVTFAPSGKVVVDALSSLRKGGVVAINAIHLDTMPAFDYDKLLWGERQIRSVANMTRADATDFLKLAQKLAIQPRVVTFSLEDANKALVAVKEETENGSAVIVM